MYGISFADATNEGLTLWWDRRGFLWRLVKSSSPCTKLFGWGEHLIRNAIQVPLESTVRTKPIDSDTSYSWLGMLPEMSVRNWSLAKLLSVLFSNRWVSWEK